MAQDDFDKEDKFDFTAEGEALGYISLEQARILAMEAAEESPGNYGNRFRGSQMVYDVVEQEEGEDYYVITLSFRPEGNFSGTPGREQFFIEKAGQIARRQLLGLPGGGKGFPVVPVLIGAVVVAIAVGVVFMVERGAGQEADTVPTVAAAPTPVPTTVAVVVPSTTTTPVPSPTSVPTVIPPTPTDVPAPSPTIKPATLVTPVTAEIPPTPTPVPPTSTPMPTDTPRPPTPTAAPPPDLTEIEPNDTNVLANNVVTGVSTGRLFERDLDWFKFDVPNGFIFELSFTPGEDASPTDVSVLTPDLDLLWREFNVGPTVTESVRQIMSSSSGGTYYVRVEEATGSYKIELTMESQNDAVSGGDAGDRLVDSVLVPLGSTFSGQIGNFDQEDWFKFQIPNGHVFDLKFTSGEDADPIDVSLFDRNQELIWREFNVGPTVSKSERRIMGNSTGGVYYMMAGESTGTYSVDISSQSQNDAGSGSDAGGKIVDALEITLESTVSGQIGDFDEEDWYKISVPTGRTFTLTFTPGRDAQPTDLFLYDPDQSLVWQKFNVGPTVAHTAEPILNNFTGGTYYVRIYEAVGSYTLDIR